MKRLNVRPKLEHVREVHVVLMTSCEDRVGDDDPK